MELHHLDHLDDLDDLDHLDDLPRPAPTQLGTGAADPAAPGVDDPQEAPMIDALRSSASPTAAR